MNQAVVIEKKSWAEIAEMVRWFRANRNTLTQQLRRRPHAPGDTFVTGQITGDIDLNGKFLGKIFFGDTLSTEEIEINCEVAEWPNVRAGRQFIAVKKRVGDVGLVWLCTGIFDLELASSSSKSSEVSSSSSEQSSISSEQSSISSNESSLSSDRSSESSADSSSSSAVSSSSSAESSSSSEQSSLSSDISSESSDDSSSSSEVSSESSAESSSSSEQSSISSERSSSSSEQSSISSEQSSSSSERSSLSSSSEESKSSESSEQSSSSSERSSLSSSSAESESSESSEQSSISSQQSSLSSSSAESRSSESSESRESESSSSSREDESSSSASRESSSSSSSSRASESSSSSSRASESSSSSEAQYDCTPETLTVTLSGIEGCGSTDCFFDFVAEDFNGTWTLSKVSGCTYQGDIDPSIPSALEVVVDDSGFGSIETLVDGTPFTVFKFTGNVGRGGTYENELTCSNTNDCESETGTCYIHR